MMPGLTPAQAKALTPERVREEGHLMTRLNDCDGDPIYAAVYDYNGMTVMLYEVAGYPPWVFVDTDALNLAGDK